MPDLVFIDTPGRPDPRKLALNEKIELLADVPLFDGASKRHLRHVARQARLAQTEPDQPLLIEGQASTVAFIITAGTAVVRRKGRKIAELGPGDVVGELGLLLDRPREASVIATSPIEVLVLDRRGLKSAVQEFPALGWQLLQTVASRLSE